jgi:hypothetical protein
MDNDVGNDVSIVITLYNIVLIVYLENALGDVKCLLSPLHCCYVEMPNNLAILLTYHMNNWR